MTIKHPALHCKCILDFSIEILYLLLVEAAALVLRLSRNVVLPNVQLKPEGYIGSLLWEDT